MARTDNLNFYNRARNRYDDDAKRVHWASKERQEIRFKTFQQLLPDISKEIIVDAGCGLAALYEFGIKHDWIPLKYIGIDCHTEMVKEARSKVDAEIVCADIMRDALPMADYYVASGSLNILDDFEMLLFIKKMILHARKGVLFNILKGEESAGVYNKQQPEKMREMLHFFKGDVEIFEGYLDDDFTVFLRMI